MDFMVVWVFEFKVAATADLQDITRQPLKYYLETFGATNISRADTSRNEAA